MTSVTNYDVAVTPRNMLEEPKKPLIIRIITNPTFIILLGAVIGFGIGIAISDGRASEEVVTWIGLPGDLFLRALKCVVLPLVFVNIILAVVDMLNVGKAVTIGTRTIIMYTLTTFLAAVEGLICVLIFKSFFSEKKKDTVDPTVFYFGCTTADAPPTEEMLLYTNPDSSLSCLANGTRPENTSLFLVNDVNSVFKQKSSGPKTDVSVSQTIQDGIFRKMVPDNITRYFAEAQFVGVIAFAIAFAVATQRVPHKKQGSLYILDLCHELNQIFLTLINWVINLTAPAVVSLIAAALGKQTDLSGVFSDIGVLVAATLSAMLFHWLVTYPTLYFIFVKKSPIPFLKHLVPAQTFAFASASSAATLPVTMKCVGDSGEVPDSVRNFVLSLGATINMDGGAIYFPTAIVFLAVSSGLSDKLDGVAYFLIILLSTIGSAGTAPVPSASLVLIITAYNTVFDTTGSPETFSYILAIDWLMDRCRTMLNVTGDAMMTRIITAMAGGAEELEVTDQDRLSTLSHNIDERLSFKHSIYETTK